MVELQSVWISRCQTKQGSDNQGCTCIQGVHCKCVCTSWYWCLILCRAHALSGALVWDLPNTLVSDTIMNVCTDPRKPVEGGSSAAAGPIGQYGVPAAYERSFKWKVGHFRNLCAVSCVLVYWCMCWCSAQTTPITAIPWAFFFPNAVKFTATRHQNCCLKRYDFWRLVCPGEPLVLSAILQWCVNLYINSLL